MRYNWLIIVAAALVMLLALFLRYFHISGVSADGAVYLQIARNLLLGKGLGWQALWFPPLYSLLLAAVSYVAGIRELVVAASIVSAVSGMFLSVAVFFLASRIFDRRIAVCASLVSACYPHLLSISFSAEAEILYTLLLVLSLGTFIRTLEKNSLLWAAFTGVAFSGAYLARSEGFLIMVFACLLLILQGKIVERRRVAKLSAMVVLVFFVASSPYLIFLHKHYGSWVISPKTSYVMIWMKSRIYHDNEKGEIFNDELWGLTADGKLGWQRSQGFTDLASYLWSHPGKSLRVYLHNLAAEIPGRIPNGSGMERFPQVFPLWLVLPGLLSLLFSWGPFSREKKAIMVAPFLILLVLPVFTEGWWKYLVPYLPLVIILGLGGIAGAANRLAVDRLPVVEGKSMLLVGLCTAAICGKFFLLHESPKGEPTSQYNRNRADYAGEVVQAGKWAVKRYGSGKNYMIAWSKLVYYLEGEWTPEPVADFYRVLQFARSSNVDLVVKEIVGEQLSDAEIMTPPPGLVFDAIYRSPTRNYLVAFYRLAS